MAQEKAHAKSASNLPQTYLVGSLSTSTAAFVHASTQLLTTTTERNFLQSSSKPVVTMDESSVIELSDNESFSVSITSPSISVTALPGSTFTCFRKLPAEIRLRIWKYMLPGPRVMKMCLKYDEPQQVQEGQKRKPKVSRFVSYCAPPVGLRVCQESRHEALKCYELAFRTKKSQAQTYVNFAIDTIVLDGMTNYFPQTGRLSVRTKKNKSVILWREFDKVQQLVVDEYFVWCGRLLTPVNFPHLSTLQILVSSRGDSNEEHGYYKIMKTDRPEPSPTFPNRADLSQDWLDGMDELATRMGPNHKAPVIDWVNLKYGTKKDEELEEEKKKDDNGDDNGDDGLEMFDGLREDIRMSMRDSVRKVVETSEELSADEIEDILEEIMGSSETERTIDEIMAGFMEDFQRDD